MVPDFSMKAKELFTSSLNLSTILVSGVVPPGGPGPGPGFEPGGSSLGLVTNVLLLLLISGPFLLGEFSGVEPLEPLCPGVMVLLD